MTSTILFFIPSPRDIPIVFEKVKEILYPDYDVLTIKYCKELEAYNRARDFFLSKKEEDYDYLCILPDDLVLNKKSLDLLISELQTGKYDVLSGICNVSAVNDVYVSLGAATINEIPTKTSTKWIKLSDYSGVRPVAFAGFPVTFISKKVVEQIEFRGDEYGNALDIEFAHDLKKKNIEHCVHFDAQFLHLKGLNHFQLASATGNRDDIHLYNVDKLFVGERPKRALFHKCNSVNQEEQKVPLLKIAKKQQSKK